MKGTSKGLEYCQKWFQMSLSEPLDYVGSNCYPLLQKLVTDWELFEA